MAMQYQPVNQATWARMTDKAHAEHVEIIRYLDCGYFLVKSGTKANVAYIASQRDCNCPSQAGYCKHSARVREYVRWLVRNGLTVDENPAA